MPKIKRKKVSKRRLYKAVRRRNPVEDDNRLEIISEIKQKLRAITIEIEDPYWYSYDQLKSLNKKLADFI
jgi:hypothetical protein